MWIFYLQVQAMYQKAFLPKTPHRAAQVDQMSTTHHTPHAPSSRIPTALKFTLKELQSLNQWTSMSSAIARILTRSLAKHHLTSNVYLPLKAGFHTQFTSGSAFLTYQRSHTPVGSVNQFIRAKFQPPVLAHKQLQQCHFYRFLLSWFHQLEE